MVRDMDEKPRLRPVEIFPLKQGEQTLLCLRDPQNFSQSVAISAVAYFILAHCDGNHSLVDIQAAYSKRFGDLLFSEDVKKLLDVLDQHYYFYNERFLEHQRKIIEDFRRLPVRPAAHAPAVYPEDPVKLKSQLDGYFETPEGPGQPAATSSRETPIAVVAPHIDFRRGGPCYAWAYKELIESPGADLYVLLGTSHCGGQNVFTATMKDFATPLGKVETDKEFVQRLQRDYNGDLFTEEHLHRTEHSLEFQVVFLQYVAHRRAEMSGEERPFKIVPILVSSFHPMVQRGTLPERDRRTGDFLKTVRELVGRESRRVCFIAGVDLAHVGMQFGDKEEVTPAFLQWVEQEDRLLIEKFAARDTEGFFHEVAKDQDRRRICGFSPLYSLIHLLDGSRGRNLKYGQAFTAETGSAVTFTSVVFD